MVAASRNLIKGSGVYEIRCLGNGKSYVGSACDLRTRKQDHWNTLQRNKHGNRYLQRAWNKYGEDAFMFIVLETCPRKTLLLREQYYIDKMGAFGKGFNMCSQAGSRLGTKHTEGAKKKMSLAKKGKVLSEEHKRKIGMGNKGKKRSEEAKRKISLAKKGRKLSEEHKRKIGLVHKGMKHTEEAKRKISLAMRGNQHTKGMKLSEETKRKMSIAHKLYWSRRRNEAEQAAKRLE